MGFRIWSLLIFVTLTACFAWAIGSAVRLRVAIKESQRGNTIGWVAEMIVSHMNANGGEWPRDWDELHDDYKSVVCEFGQPWQFVELRANVQIDWEADPVEIRERMKAGEFELRVLRMLGDPPHEDRVTDANQKVIDCIAGFR